MDAPAASLAPPEWRFDDAPVPYAEALAAMEARAEAVRAGTVPELVWLLEHPPTYTGGTSARDADLLDARGFDVHRTGRGGEWTYHGPGQRVGYAVLDLGARGGDVRAYVRDLEEWVIRTLARFGVEGERRAGRPGVWVRRTDLGAPSREDKVAALGVRVRRWVSLHGVAINLEPDLSHYAGIVPCGIREHGVTSLADLGLHPGGPALDMAMREAFAEVFGAPR